MEALFLDERRNPASCLVQFNQALLDICYFNEPAIKASVNKRCLTTPAEGITMLNSTVSEKSTLSFQVLDDCLISILDVDALIS